MGGDVAQAGSGGTRHQGMLWRSVLRPAAGGQGRCCFHFALIDVPWLPRLV